MPTNPSSKKTEISMLNIMLCLFVVFIHVSSAPVSQLNKASFQYMAVMIPWRLSAFVVQGFIFLSGLKFFIKGTDNFNYTVFLKKRIKTIIIPYLIWVMVYYVYFCAIGYFPFSIKDYIIYVINGSIVSPFYFIVIIVQFYILMPLWIKLFKTFESKILVIISFILMIMAKKYLPLFIGNSFLYYDRIFTTYLFYWILGCAAGLNYNSFRALASKIIFFSAAAFAIAALSDAYFSLKSFAYMQYVPFLENLHVLYCITAILFSFGFFAVLSDKGFKFGSILKNIDSSSFYIYLSHCFVMNIIDHITARLGIYSIGEAYLLRFISVYVITITLCVCYIKLKKRILSRR